MKRMLRRPLRDPEATRVEVEFERVYCSKRVPEMTHAAIYGAAFTAAWAVCGRPVVFRLGTHETDTVSQIECSSCRAWIERETA